MVQEEPAIAATGPARSTGPLQDSAEVWALRWVHPPLGTTLLGPAPILIGRDAAQCGVVLADPDVSRRHCEVRGGGTPRVADLGSRNGIRVEGSVVTEATLTDGAVLRVGTSIAVVVRAPDLDTLEAPFTALVGNSYYGSGRLAAVLRQVARLAERDESMLILGESGSGKEQIANYVHQMSARQGPFVAFNCSTIRGDLAAATLFGHVPGAFSGATRASDGALRTAERGTLFLDEVGELPLDVQPMLLRCLEQREVVPVGASRPVPITARIVCATHRDLEKRIRAKRFREDLYHRLATYRVALPPLRRRREDILALFCHYSGRPSAELSAGFVERLLLHEWSGNVRELRNLARSLTATVPQSVTLTGRHLEDILAATESQAEPPRAVAARDLSAGDWKALFQKHRGVAAEISRATGIPESTVKRYLKQHRLRESQA